VCALGTSGITGYADDTCVWSWSSNLESLIADLEAKADRFADYVASCGLILNADKTQLLLAGKKDPNFTVMVNGSRVTPGDNLELLGVKFACDLSTRPHQAKLAASLRQRASLIARLAHHLPRGPSYTNWLMQWSSPWKGQPCGRDSTRNKMPTTPTSVQPKSPLTTSLVPSRAKSARTTSRLISSCTMQVSPPSTRCPSSRRPWRPGKHSTAETAEMRSATSSARPSSAATRSSTTAERDQQGRKRVGKSPSLTGPRTAWCTAPQSCGTSAPSFAQQQPNAKHWPLPIKYREKPRENLPKNTSKMTVSKDITLHIFKSILF
jgi:hypothetical protein